MVLGGVLKWGRGVLQDPYLDNYLINATTTLVGSFVYVHGGEGRSACPLYRFCLVSGKWVKLKGAPYRYKHTCILANDKLYLIGGVRNGRRDLPLEIYDLAVETSEEFNGCDEPNQIAAYLESRQQIMILGGISRIRTYGFDVETNVLMAYLTRGETPPYHTRQCLIAEDEQLYFTTQSRNIDDNRTTLYMLKLAASYSATWSKLKLPGSGLLVHSLSLLQASNGLIICFGADRVERSFQLFIIDPSTGEATRAGTTITESSWSWTGSWALANTDVSSFVRQGTIWIVGGRQYSTIVKLEALRT